MACSVRSQSAWNVEQKRKFCNETHPARQIFSGKRFAPVYRS
jgi:hypothetical protein